MSTPAKKFDANDWLVVYDGIEYPLPIPVTPREDAVIQRLTDGRSWKEAFESLESLSLTALSALLIVAMRRKNGTVNEDEILDDARFLEKFEFRQVGVEVVDALPPGVAAAAASAQPSSSATPGGSGDQS